MRTHLLLALVIVTALSPAALAVPNAPQNLTVSISGTTVALEWDAPAGGSTPAEYVIEAAPFTAGPAIASFPVVSTAKFFTDVPHGTYYVRVRALDGTGSSAPSNEVEVVVPGNTGCNTAPAAPAALINNTTGNTVRLSWTAPSAGCRVASYHVHAGSFPGSSNLGVFDAGEATMFAASAPTGTYYVRVVATNGFGASAASNEVEIRPGVGCPTTPTPPSQPFNLTASATGSVVTLNWGAPFQSCNLTSYIVHVGSAPGLSDVAVLDVGIVHSVSGIAPEGSYYVRVFATGDGGTSAASNEKGFVIASGSVTVGFNGLSSVTIGTPLVSYSEAGFTIALAGANWTAGGTSIVFRQQSQFTDTTGELTITSRGELFTFAAVDIYASITHVPYEFVGLRNGTPVYAASGVLPNPRGNYLTVMNPHAPVRVDAVVIRLTHPPTPQLTCPAPPGQCLSPAGVDNIVLVR